MILACEDRATSPCRTLQHLAKPNQLLKTEAKVWILLRFTLKTVDDLAVANFCWLFLGEVVFFVCFCHVLAMLLLWCCYACKTKPNQTIIHYQKVIENTKEYQKILKLSRNFRKYPIVPENTRKYKKVSETTRKYKEVSEAIRHYQKVPENTKNYKKWPKGQEMARMWLAEKNVA